MLAHYNTYYASDDPAVRAVMDKIARNAFDGVSSFNNQQNMQVALGQLAQQSRASYAQQVARDRAQANLDQLRAEEAAAKKKPGFTDYMGGLVDTLSIAGHGIVNFGGGAVNALADTVDLVVDVGQTTFNAVSPTCWTKTFCAAIPNIPSVPIYGDPALYKYSQASGYVTTVAVEFVATGGAGLVADGFSAAATAAKTLPRLVTDLPAVVNDLKTVVKAATPALKELVPKLPGLIKTTVTGVADNAAAIVKNPAAFLSDLKTGLNNPVTTPGGIFGTPPATAADITAAEGADITAAGHLEDLPAAAGTTYLDDLPVVATDAGSVNPLGGTHNCVACAIAGDSTLGGNPASALDLYPGRAIPGGNQLIVEYAGAPWRSVSGQGAIECELLEAGNGARGIVYGTDGEYAHVWNAVVQDGRVNYVDFQGIGPNGPAAFDPWTKFQFVRTN